MRIKTNLHSVCYFSFGSDSALARVLDFFITFC
jgi:hypothetical protein